MFCHLFAALNITSGVLPGVPETFSSPVVTGSFGTVVITGNFSQSAASEVVYDATIRCGNGSQNTRGRDLVVEFAVFINSAPQPIRLYFLKVCAETFQTFP